MAFISNVVLDEIEEARLQDRRQMFHEIGRVSPIELRADPVSEQLANEYLTAGVLPAKKRDDARHVAIATIADMDILVSWNHRHLANERKKELFNAINRKQGRERLLLIHTPFEVLS